MGVSRLPAICAGLKLLVGKMEGEKKSDGQLTTGADLEVVGVI